MDPLEENYWNGSIEIDRSDPVGTVTPVKLANIPINTEFEPIIRNSKFPPEIIDVLDKYFQINSHPRTSKMAMYAKELGLRYSQVNNWFKNNQHRRRYRFTGTQKKIMHNMLTNSVDGVVDESAQIEIARKFGINEKYVKYWFHSEKIDLQKH